MSSEATYSQATSDLTNVFSVLEEGRKFLNTASKNFVDLARTYQQASKASGDRATAAAAALGTYRKNLEAFVGNPGVVIDPLFDQLAKSPQVASSKSALTDQFTDAYVYMDANTLSVKSRAFTYGPFVNGAQMNGSGAILRCTVDAYGYYTEAQFAEATKWLVEFDQNIGGRPAGQEQFRVTAGTWGGIGERGVSTRGSGLNLQVTAVNGDDSILTNASFSERSGNGSTPDTAPTAVTGWTPTTPLVGDGTDVVVDRTYYFQANNKENGSPACLKLKTDNTWSQTIASLVTTGTKITTDLPYHPSLAVSPLNTGAVTGVWIGLVTLTLGSKSAAFPVTGAKPAGTTAAGGSVNDGIHYYCFTITKGGIEGPPSPVSAAITPGGGSNTVNLTGITAGPASSSKRTVYRTKAGVATMFPQFFFKVADIGDNTTTIYADTTADSGLSTALSAIQMPDANGYVVVALPASNSTAKDLWAKNWNQAGAAFSFATAKTSGTALLADRAMLLPYVSVSQTSPVFTTMYFLPLSGSTAWLYNDVGTTTDTETGAVNQTWMHMRFGRSLPSSGSATWTDPS